MIKLCALCQFAGLVKYVIILNVSENNKTYLEDAIMTIAEKIEMYKGKKAFVDGLSAVFQNNPRGTTVTEIAYEVYQKEVENNTYFREYVIVHFSGGSIAPRTVNGNSNHANLRAIGSLVDGGYYDEVEDYRNLEELGYERVILY
jgi:hypothetical protein